MLKNSLIYAYRTLKKQKVYSVLGILGFAAGLAVFIDILLFVDHEYSMDTGYENYKRIFRIVETDSEGQNADLDYDIYPSLKEQYPEIEMACPVRQKEKWPFVFQTSETFIKTSSFISTTNEFFSIFSVEVLKSLGKEPLPDKNSVVLTQSTASKLFPESDAIGQAITFLGGENLVVSAIIKDLPNESSFSADLILKSENPRYRFGRTFLNGKIINPINHFILLKKKVDPRELAQKINNSFPGYTNSAGTVLLQPVESIYFTKGIKGDYNKKGNIALIYLLEAVAAIILILACINYVHFILATQLSTKKSAGIKRIHGAGFRGLLSYYFAESSLSLGIALMLAIGLVVLGLPVVNNLLETSLAIGQLFSLHVLAIWAGTIIFIVFMVAFISGWAASKHGITSLLKPATMSYNSLSNTFFSVFQMAVSIALIVCAIGINRQLRLMQHKSLGFDAEHVLRLDMPFSFNAYQVMKEKIKSLSFVKDCAWSCGGPGYINIEGAMVSGDKSISLHGISGDKDFLQTMGITCLEGRTFLPSDKDYACVVNQSALKAAGCKNLEEFLSIHGNILNYKVVGVVNDFNIASFHSSIDPCYIAFSDEDRSSLNIKLSEGSVLDEVRQVRKIWKEVIPNHPFEVTFYDEYFNSLYNTERSQSKVIMFFSFITIFITCLGLLGQIIHRSVIRTKEIGIRKVNGAKISEILSMLNKDFVKWVAIAFVIATPVAYYAMNKWLENFAYKINLSWWIFALAGLLALGIALLTVSWQSWRAATRNPVEALRYE